MPGSGSGSEANGLSMPLMAACLGRLGFALQLGQRLAILRSQRALDVLVAISGVHASIEH